MPDLRSLPRIELVSVFMNKYRELDEEARIAYRAEFSRRGLPIPKLDDEEPPHSRAAAIERSSSLAEAALKKEPLDQRTFLSYVLLIYTLTGLVYSWIFLAERLVRRTGVGDHRHRAIMTIISLAYVAVEALVVFLFQME